jgi:23S rRNA pseudouridine2457 synthase
MSGFTKNNRHIEEVPVYYAVNKPNNMLSQFTDKLNRETLASLHGIPQNVYPAGRLDNDSEGLLLLTNDKKIVDRLLSPEYEHEKEYLVQIEGIPAEKDLDKLRASVKIKDYKTKPAHVELLKNVPRLWERHPPIRFRASIPTSWLKIIITEGKNRQIRKMTAAIGFPTLRLIRIRICNIQLNNLKPGSFRQLSDDEIKGLLKLLGM